ncbi:MAG: hypothetical protein M0Q51_16970 [Bacteroidales bacterium]|nr:hypothetical protein [Bacteroidales bacterium]
MIGEFIWRCAKCTCHFATITKFAGFIKQEKKCPKCKSLNVLTIKDKEIYIQCQQPTAADEFGMDQAENGFTAQYRMS